MKPVLVIVGRPNVGKSTLFNRLTKSRDALVADLPGLTRDRHYGTARFDGTECLIVDTGGFEPVVKEGIVYEMAKQTRQAMAEADLVIFLVDGRTGLTELDREIGRGLRKLGTKVLLAVNKSEGMNRALAAAEFHELGLGQPLAISGAHGEGVHDLIDEAFEVLGIKGEQPPEEMDQPGIKVAIAGRPNVGKSTLINALLGEERVIAYDQPGTTRDAIEVPFVRAGKPYTLIDTAGLRKRGQVFEAVEKFSVIKTLQAIESCNVVVLMLDARQDISEQDAHIAGFIVEQGRALVVAINKWEGLDEDVRENAKKDFARKLMFVDFAKVHFISALQQTGIGALMRSVDEAYTAAMAKLSTPRLTRTLMEAVEKQQPPRRGGIRPKLRYAHQGGQNPPVVVIHGNALDKVGSAYQRYLQHTFLKEFKLAGTPLRVQFKSSKNPFAREEN